ncbi:uncharacterized protein LOC122501377 [Leptopilina heterotoma]|uniref:uncharacterized protein LOC122501377 n=1 Tax=Leptopilina heterotoma TaxID=63436 RepID=UPI001CAA2B60|nr:uncharacterized protein LOC122501377 [Leptopilina heterotoma]
MDYRRKFLTGLGLILILLVGKISIITENNVEKTEINPLTFENDICTIYDNLSVINSMLFEKEYKPLIVIIADKFIDGINRVRNLSESKRILNDAGIQNNPYYSLLYQTVSENIYLFQANDTYYFVYPVDFQDNFLTIYFQWKLLHNNLGIIFHFFDVKKEFPFFDDIFIPLQPSCTNCPLVKYINEKLQKGESFSELFELRKQLFREQKTKNLTFTPFDNDYICTWMGFNNNSQSSRSLMRFNSLLEQIQNNSANVEKSKRRRTVERSLSCFQSRYLYFRISEHYVQNFLITNGYLNWINRTISSLRGNDVSYGGLCENKHRIEILKFFCFMKDISDVTSHYIPAWTEALKKLVTKPLSIILKWYNLARYFYTDEYIIIVDPIVSIINTIFHRALEEFKRLNDKLNNTNEKRDILSRITDYKYETSYITICTIYEHWKTIDDLVLEVKSNRLVIIVADNMRTGIATVNKIKTSRVVPKVRREDLHYSEQFLYDVIMKNIYLVQ